MLERGLELELKEVQEEWITRVLKLDNEHVIRVNEWDFTGFYEIRKLFKKFSIRNKVIRTRKNNILFHYKY